MPRSPPSPQFSSIGSTELIGKEFMGGTGLLFALVLNSVLRVSTIYLCTHTKKKNRMTGEAQAQ